MCRDTKTWVRPRVEGARDLAQRRQNRRFLVSYLVGTAIMGAVLTLKLC